MPSPDLLYRMGFLPHPRGIASDAANPTLTRVGNGDEGERKDFDDVQNSVTVNEKYQINVQS